MHLPFRSLAITLLLVATAAPPLASALPATGLSAEVDAGPVQLEAHARAPAAPAIHVPLTLADLRSLGPAALGAPAVATRALEMPDVRVAPSLPLSPPVPTAPDAPTAAAAAPPVAQAVAATGALWMLGHVFAALYSRLAPSQLLDNERRERVLTLVRERPGIGPAQVGEALGTGWGVTTYHLERMERAGLILSQRSGHHRCYFVPGALPREVQARVSLFRVETTRRIATLVASAPGLTQSELARQLGLSASATSKQISRLATEQLVRREATDAGQRLFPLPGLAAALAPATV